MMRYLVDTFINTFKDGESDKFFKERGIKVGNKRKWLGIEESKPINLAKRGLHLRK